MPHAPRVPARHVTRTRGRLAPAFILHQLCVPPLPVTITGLSDEHGVDTPLARGGRDTVLTGRLHTCPNIVSALAFLCISKKKKEKKGELHFPFSCRSTANGCWLRQRGTEVGRLLLASASYSSGIMRSPIMTCRVSLGRYLVMGNDMLGRLASCLLS